MNKCINCNSHKFKIVLRDREDFEYNNPVKLNYYQCLECGHIAVYPMPSTEEINTFYLSYTTHSIYKPSFISRLIDDITKYQKKQELKKILKNKNLKAIKVLDFGSGNGNFLAILSALGVENACGFDFDQKAAQCAIEQGYTCFTSFNEFENNKYDYIFLNHVIEHLPDPKGTIKRLLQLLTENGKIIIRTPNSGSLLAMYFKVQWRGWETPRHLNIFNHKSIKMFNDLEENFEVKKITTSNMMFIGIFIGSIDSNKYNSKIIKKIVQFFSILLFVPAYIVNIIEKNRGEELCFGISKNSEETQ